LLAFRARHVTGVESSAAVHKVASQNLQQQAISKVSLELGDAAKGWSKATPYDVIVVTGSLQILPEELKQQLNIGGRLFVVLGSAPIMTAYLITRLSATEFDSKGLFETSVPVVPHAERLSGFSF
jgi:protein-L-isoaspartate(D-aspartate) O-methyltransferase